MKRIIKVIMSIFLLTSYVAYTCSDSNIVKLKGANLIATKLVGWELNDEYTSSQSITYRLPKKKDGSTLAYPVLSIEEESNWDRH